MSQDAQWRDGGHRWRQGCKYWRDIHITACHGLFGFWKCLNFAFVKAIFIHWIRKGTLVIKIRSQFYWEEEWIIEMSLLVVGPSLLLCLLLNKEKQTHLLLLPLLPQDGIDMCHTFVQISHITIQKSILTDLSIPSPRESLSDWFIPPN